MTKKLPFVQNGFEYIFMAFLLFFVSFPYKLCPVNPALPPIQRTSYLIFAFGLRFSPASLAPFWGTLTHVCVLKARFRTSNIDLFANGVSLLFGQLSTTKIPDLYAIFLYFNNFCIRSISRW